MNGRGHSVSVEFALDRQVLDFLGVTPEAVLDFQQLVLASSQAIGMLGNNLHLANALSALYLATGQDTACVAENAVAFSQASPDGGGGLQFRMTLPSLTVGGGAPGCPASSGTSSCWAAGPGLTTRSSSLKLSPPPRPLSSFPCWPQSSPARSPRPTVGMEGTRHGDRTGALRLRIALCASRNRIGRAGTSPSRQRDRRLNHRSSGLQFLGEAAPARYAQKLLNYCTISRYCALIRVRIHGFCGSAGPIPWAMPPSRWLSLACAARLKSGSEVGVGRSARPFPASDRHRRLQEPWSLEHVRTPDWPDPRIPHATRP